MDFAARVRRVNNRLPCISLPQPAPEPVPVRLRSLPHGDRHGDYSAHDAGGFATEWSDPDAGGDDDWDWEG